MRRTFAVIGVGVVEAAGEIAGETVAQGELSGEDGAAAASQTAAASSVEYGTSNFMTSLTVSVPFFSLLTHSGVCTRRRSSRRARSGSRMSAGAAIFSCRRSS